MFGKSVYVFISLKDKKMFHTLEYHFKITKYLYGIGLKNLVCVDRVWSGFGRCGVENSHCGGVI